MEESMAWKTERMQDSAPHAQVDAHAAQVRIFKRQDSIFQKLTFLFAFLVLAALAGILMSLAIEATPAFRAFGAAFLWRDVWSIPDDEFGALISIYGTVSTSLIALLIGVPVSFGIALFLTESCPAWLASAAGDGH
jgi:phosphate transport system permease protein